MTAPAHPVPADATPVMAQFFGATARQPDALLFFRMGDFYELFFDDAEKAAAALGIALTRRGGDCSFMGRFRLFSLGFSEALAARGRVVHGRSTAGPSPWGVTAGRLC